MLEAGNHDLVDKELLTLLNVVSHVFAVRLAGNRLDPDIEGGVGKPVIEIVIQDVFPVGRQILLRIGLAFGRAQERTELIRGNLLIADNAEGANQRLRAFCDLHVNRQPVCAFMVVLHLGLDLYLAKTV